jgi:hypothetical protein
MIVGGGQGHLRDVMALQQPAKACSSEYVIGNENRGACKEPETENRQQEFQSEHELFLSTPVAGEACECCRAQIASGKPFGELARPAEGARNQLRAVLNRRLRNTPVGSGRLHERESSAKEQSL